MLSSGAKFKFESNSTEKTSEERTHKLTETKNAERLINRAKRILNDQTVSNYNRYERYNSFKSQLNLIKNSIIKAETVLKEIESSILEEK